ncbi:hypothetical protein EFD56_26030 [Rhizobium phaseoli]|nr:hypothetical protein EFD56_26030 [Rhizobium phaseoli]
MAIHQAQHSRSKHGSIRGDTISLPLTRVSIVLARSIYCDDAKGNSVIYCNRGKRSGDEP